MARVTGEVSVCMCAQPRRGQTDSRYTEPLSPEGGGRRPPGTSSAFHFTFAALPQEESSSAWPRVLRAVLVWRLAPIKKTYWHHRR